MWPQVVASELQGVVLAPRGLSDATRIEMLEIYEDGVGVRWSKTLRPGDEREDLGWPDPGAFSLSDDLGTDYRMATGGGHAGPRTLRGLILYGPRVPQRAASMVVNFPEGTTRFDLASLIEPPS